MNEKKVGRPKGRKYTIRKEILLTLDQAKNWNPDNIRDFLDNGHNDSKYEQSEYKRFEYKDLVGKVHRGSKEDLDSKLAKIHKTIEKLANKEGWKQK